MKKAKKYCQKCGEKTESEYGDVCKCPKPFIERLWKKKKTVGKHVYTIGTITLVLLIIATFARACFISNSQYHHEPTKRIDDIGQVGMVIDVMSRTNEILFDLRFTSNLQSYYCMISLYDCDIPQDVTAVPCNDSYNDIRLSYIKCTHFNVSISNDTHTWLAYEHIFNISFTKWWYPIIGTVLFGFVVIIGGKKVW